MLDRLEPKALQALLDGLTDEVALVDGKGSLLRANRAFCRRRGMGDPEVVAGRPLHEVMAAAEVARMLAAVQLALVRPDPVAGEELRGDGDAEAWLSTTTSAVHDADGRPWAALIVVRDVTVAKRLEQDLRDSEALYHSLVEQLPMNVFRKDRLGRFVFANARLCRTLGISPDAVVGKTDHDFSPRPLADKYRQDDDRVMSTGDSFHDVEEHHPRDGEPTYVQVFKTALRNARGKVIGTQGFFIDITHLKRTEETLVKQRGELEQAVRALGENQQRLLLAEKMASLGRLTAGIAHEMNTPLAAVRAAVAELQALVGEYRDSIGDADVGPEDHQQIAAEMERSLALAATAARRAAGFVQGIKSQTRDLAPRERVRFDGKAVVEEALLLLTHAARQAQCVLRFDAPDETLELEGAPGRLAQVVTNLVKNALDASTSKGGGPVTVRLRTQARSRVLEVSDAGTGIPADVVNKIFDPMFTTKPFGEGTGLGLTIVHDIVVGDFGGSIRVETELGTGTTFLVQFPAPDAPPEELRHAP